MRSNRTSNKWGPANKRGVWRKDEGHTWLDSRVSYDMNTHVWKLRACAMSRYTWCKRWTWNKEKGWKVRYRSIMTVSIITITTVSSRRWKRLIGYSTSTSSGWRPYWSYFWKTSLTSHIRHMAEGLRPIASHSVLCTLRNMQAVCNYASTLHQTT